MSVTVPPTPADNARMASGSLPADSRLMPPDARELGSIAGAAVIGAIAFAGDAGPRLLASWLPESLTTLSPLDAAIVVAAQFLPWLIALVALSLPFSLRWLPRVHQRLLEPSLIASWVTVGAAGGVAYGLGFSGLWPWTWATTTPETASLLTRFMQAEDYVAVGLWAVGACLLVPVVLELVFRFALLEWLRRRGLSTWAAVAISSVAFGAFYLQHWRTLPVVSLQQAAVASLLGAVLGTIAVRGRGGRGLGLAIMAHGTFAAVQLAVLLSTVIPS